MAYYYLVAPIAVMVHAHEPYLTYHSDQPLALGSLVRISIGSRSANGVVFQRVKDVPTFATKPIAGLLAASPLPEPLLKLAVWLSGYYASHLATVLQTMLPAGLHKQRRIELQMPPHPIRSRAKIVFNPEQQAALTTLRHSPRTKTVLLHGVTGSGKTRVYIEAALEQAKQGRSSIVLVPEIALTPQLVAEFAHFFERLIVTHSGMTEANRHLAWQKALQQTDKPTVVIGPRSALFMPLNNVGLIVADECHEPSYKQEQAPRYLALRAATMLASYHKDARVILGSATPSVTDYYVAKRTKSPVITLNKPAIETAPVAAEVVDLKDKGQFSRHRFLSNTLLARIEQSLQEERQTLLFHNRRGTAPTTLCEHCGWLAECPTCFLPMTLHGDQHILRCHLCNHQQPVPPNCPACHEPTIIFKGIGTKMIETEVVKLFPKARVARFDADTAAAQALHHRYQELYDGHIDILIGTQMLAKGLDLPRLDVVGVVQADSGLVLPDFQAEERVFQLLYQVMGRVGRNAHQGHVVVQTFQPVHPVIKAALARDYSAFYKEEIQKRRMANLPPFRYLLKLTCSYKTERGAVNASRTMAKTLRQQYPALEVLGPTPAFHERLGNTYRWQLVVKSQKRSELATIAMTIPANWQADLDPASLL